jgi:hypothetical protein
MAENNWRYKQSWMGTNIEYVSKNIRYAINADIPRLLEMGADFFASSGYAEFGDYDLTDTTECFQNLIANKTLLTDGKHGALGFVIYPLYMSKKALFAQELFYYVAPEKRGSRLALDLLNCFETVAKQRQASAVSMISLDHGDFKDKTARLYQRLNYKLKEQIFLKSL